MNTSEALLAAVLANPADDLPRLVYADYLEENREPEQAAFIRAQVAGGKGRAEFLAWGDRYLTDDAGAAHLIPHLNEAGGPTVVYRRGFVADITCTLSQWCGGMCHVCGGIGDLLVQTDYGSTQERCLTCHGAGRTTGIGPAVVRSHPVEVVRVSDREPLEDTEGGGPWTWWRQSTQYGAQIHEVSNLPDDLFTVLLKVAGKDAQWGGDGWTAHGSRDAAVNDLSAALIAWAKSQPHPARITTSPVSVDVTG